MALKLHILQASGIISGEAHNTLVRSLEDTFDICNQCIKLADIDIVVMNMPWQVIPELGIMGFAYDKHQISITLDCSHDNIKANLYNTVQSILAHELHHCARSLATGKRLSSTLGSQLVAEGLACCFEEEIGQPTPCYANAFTGAVFKTFLTKAKEHAKTKYEQLPGNPRQWMIGNFQNPKEYPYYCGYSTGYALIKNWLNHVGLTASQAVGVDSNEVIDLWLKDEIELYGIN